VNSDAYSRSNLSTSCAGTMTVGQRFTGLMTVTVFICEITSFSPGLQAAYSDTKAYRTPDRIHRQKA
jgi:hypothetical protein